MLFRFQDEGDSGGAADINDDGGSADANTDNNDGGAADTDDSGGSADIKTPEIPKFDDTETANTEFSKLFTDYHSKLKDLDEITLKHEDLSKRVGDQGNDLSVFNKIKSELRDNPVQLITKLAKESGVDISFGNEKSVDDMDNIATLLSGTPEEIKEGTNKLSDFIDKKVDDKLKTNLAPVRNTLVDTHLAQKYEDYGNLSGIRETIALQVKTGGMDKSELLHLAARATKLNDFSKKEFERGRESAKAEFREKYKNQLGNAGGHVNIEKSKIDPKKMFDDIAKSYEGSY